MKILFVDNCIYSVGGVQMIISTLANKLSEKYNVDILSVLKTNEGPHFKINNNVNIFNVLDFVKINRIYSKTRKRKNLKYYLLRIFEEVKKKLILKRKIKKMYDIIDLYDVIIFGRIETANLFFKVLGKSFESKNVIVRDSMNLDFYNKKIKYEISKYFPKYVNTIVTSSDECIKKFNEFFNRKVNVVKIYNPLGISPQKVGNMNNKIIIAVGRMDKQKGFDALLKIFKIVNRKYNDWKLYIYGDGVNKYKLLEKIKNIGLSDFVFLKGNSNDMVSSLNNGSIFAFTSRYEGYANALVEAMSCGLPCISFNFLTGVEEIITKNRYNGIIVNLENRYDYFNGIDNDNDIESFANEIINMIQNPILTKKIGDNASKIIKSRETNMICKKWEEIINNGGDNNEYNK